MQTNWVSRFGSQVQATSVAVLLSVCLADTAAAEPNYPTLTGRIVDQAGLLSTAERAEIETELSALETTSTDQLAIVTVSSLEGYAIEDYSIGLARKWGIGQEGKDNGVVLLVAPKERKVRIEVGRRLEPMLTDTMSKLIIQNAILPGFRRGDFAGGIRAGVRDIKDVLLGDAEAVRKRARGRNRNEIETEELIMLAIWLAIFIYIFYQHYQQAKRVGPRNKRRRHDDGSVIIIPSGHRDHWDGGWSGGGGGGGWSGGGGGFGGGGASGSW
ncbi:MAG: TPM domain-containing protein [Alphaproteobacteria bacterium]|nr:TPM domain-containing protein [Alphaproteobacteria bacterium]